MNGNELMNETMNDLNNFIPFDWIGFDNLFKSFHNLSNDPIDSKFELLSNQSHSEKLVKN